MAWQDFIGSYDGDYVPADVIEAMSRSHVLGIFMRMDTDPGFHVWMGIADIPAGYDSIDEEGTVYLGGGTLINVPTLETLVNGQAGDVTFGISGIDPATANRVLDELPEVRGKDVRIGIMTLDQYYQPMGPIIALWRGTASHTSERQGPAEATEDDTVTVSLAVISGSATRSRANQSLWSAAHHKSKYPDDRFCDQTARLARGVAPPWPAG